MFPIKPNSPGASPFLKDPQPSGGGLLGRIFGSSPPTRGLLSQPQPQGQAAQEPSFWDRFDGQPGLGGWLADDQRRARIGIALEQMRMHPSEQRMEYLQGQLGEDGRSRGLLDIFGRLGGQQAPGAAAQPPGETMPQRGVWQRQTFY